MQTITPFLWFDNNLGEALRYYLSVFDNMNFQGEAKFGETGPGPDDEVMVAEFEINGQAFIGLNGGPMYKFSPAVSFAIHCDTQAEVDHLWEALSSGGETNACGWLTDKFGLTWQVVPRVLGKLLQDPDPAKSGNVMKAMMQMSKLEIAGLQAAYDSAG